MGPSLARRAKCTRRARVKDSGSGGAPSSLTRHHDQGGSVTFPRQEIEAAFAEFRQLGTGEHNWSGWADLFTDDATYVEHNLGTMRGRQQIKDFIVDCMADYGAMTFDIEWSMVDGDRV